jgi:hypothetical protein
LTKHECCGIVEHTLSLYTERTTMGKLKGQSEYLKFLDGIPLTMKQTIVAQCFICNGAEEGSGEDCKGNSCPLYPYFRKWSYKGRTSKPQPELPTSPLDKDTKEVS